MNVKSRTPSEAIEVIDRRTNMYLHRLGHLQKLRAALAADGLPPDPPSNDHLCHLIEQIVIPHIRAIHLKVSRIMVTETELAADMRATKAQADKVNAELRGKMNDLNTKIDTLQATIDSAGTDVPAEVLSAWNDVKASLQTVDDIVPDVPAPSEPPAPAPEPAPEPAPAPAEGTDPNAPTV